MDASRPSRKTESEHLHSKRLFVFFFSLAICFLFFLSRTVIASCLLLYWLYRASERENICCCLSTLYLLMLEPRVIVALKCNLVVGHMLFSFSLCDAFRMFLQCVFFVTLHSLRRIESIY
jgi:hypothetical protein